MTPPPHRIRRPGLRSGLVLWALVSNLVALAACGSIKLTNIPATSPPARPPGATLTTTQPNATGLKPSPASTSPATPDKFTVVLDPGHNGANASHPTEINRPVPNGRGSTKACNTTGTSTAADYPEHAFNWDVALQVRDALTARGVQVVLTRPDNTGVGPCVNDRATIANRTGADAMVSIHADGATRSGHGFHVAYSDPPLNASQGPSSVALATALATALRGEGFTPANYKGADGLDPRSDLAGLNHARIPAALVECANMRNPQEAALVSTPDGRTRYATAIADGIMAWLTSQ